MRRLLALFSLTLYAAGFAAEPIDLSADEFKMYRQYLNAMQDPRVQKMKPAAQRPAIAKDAGFKLKDMEHAITKGEAAGNLKSRCEGNAKEALAGTELADRMGKIDVDVSEPHAVAYVQWLNEDLGRLEEEASLVAAHVAAGCPVLSTVQVWAMDKAQPSKRVFQALISREAATRINLQRVQEFADTRYIRLFEKVKSAAAGDTL